PATKGAKGGFSVGGYDMTKGGVAAQNYLDVSKDSVRIYIDSNPATKGVRGGFAVGGYDMTKGGSTNYLNVNTDTSGIIRPSQNRILWYPIKDAFLTGRVLVEKPDSVGTNSFASGFESKAKGQYSQALGYKAIARGNYSTSIGFQSVAQDSNSFAFGQDAFAFGKSSYAIGNGAIAHGRGSYAFGSAGYDQYGVPTGQITQALGDFSVALGLGAKTTGRGAIAFGSNVLSTGYGAVAMGYYTSAPGACSLACNYYTVSSGSWSFASGANSQATNNYSTAMGTWTTASGSASTSMGDHTTAPSFCETAIGSFNTTYTPASTYSWNTSDRLFVIGNGTNSSPSNAVTVMKTGYTAIGNVSPTQMLDVNGNARFRTVTSGTFVSDLNLASDGTLTTATSDIRMKENIIQITNALTKVNELRGVTFTWKNDSTKTRQIGMIAQEVEPIVPEIVFTNPVDGLKGINYSQASALFVEAIKEQQKQIESQQKEIDELKTLVNTLIANQTAQVNK
ncbi:MAG: tail fiber domain-containing protein, partial [Bacteroidales bacterium]